MTAMAAEMAASSTKVVRGRWYEAVGGIGLEVETESGWRVVGVIETRGRRGREYYEICRLGKRCGDVKWTLEDARRALVNSAGVTCIVGAAIEQSTVSALANVMRRAHVDSVLACDMQADDWVLVAREAGVEPPDAAMVRAVISELARTEERDA